MGYIEVDTNQDATEWLDLGGVTRVLDYADAGDAVALAFFGTVGVAVLTRTQRCFVLGSMKP